MRSLGIGMFGIALLGLGCQPNMSAQDESKAPPKVGFAEDRVPKPDDPKTGGAESCASGCIPRPGHL